MSTPRIERTRIGQEYGWEEEGPCQSCGTPLFEGDPAWLIKDGTQVMRFAYCSRACCQRALYDLVAALTGGAR